MATSSFYSSTGPNAEDATALEGYKTQAAASADAAATSAANAASSASSIGGAVSSAQNAQAASEAARDASVVAKNAADTSSDASAASATSSATSATASASSASSAATSASQSSSSATAAAGSATSASNAQSAAEAAKDAALAAFDSFDDRYLGQKSSDPTTDNDGNALVAGTLYFNTTTNDMKVYEGSVWVNAYASLTGVLLEANNLSDVPNAATARSNLGLGTAATTDASDYATAAQADQTVSLTGSGATSVSGTYPNFTISSSDNNTTYSVGDGGLTEINFTSADNTKLDGIESGATADQTAAEIKTAYESNANTNAFTDADHTKLDGIEANADVTDTANVTAAGALMDSELASEASVKALNQGVATTDSPSFVNLTLSGTGSVKVPSGTTAQRDGSPVNGMFRYNSTNEQFEGYQGGDWGAIGGGGGSNTFTADTFTGDGSTTAYALSQVINSEDNLLVFIDGVFQQQSAYSIATASGTTTLTFATAPANTREIIVYSVASAVSGSNLNIDSMTGDGSDTTLSLTIAPVNENNTQVFIDGVYQNKDTYSISGTTLTFSTAPPNGSAVEVMTMTQTEVNVPVDGTITPAKIASGDFYFDTNTLYVDATNNRVAIGTSSPTVNLDIQDSSQAVIKVGDGSTVDMRMVADVASGVGSIRTSGSTSVMAMYTGGSERLRIDSSGKVGIGTTSPNEALHVYNATTNVLANFESGDSKAFISFKDNSTTNTDTVFLGADGDNMAFYAGSASSERLSIDCSGQVGINTNSPSAVLEVRGVAPSYTLAATTFWGGTTNNDDHNGIMLSSYGNALGGSVGSNLTYANSATPSQTNTGRSSGEIQFGNTTTGSRTSDIKFGGYYKGTTSYTERMRIDSSGRLLVGTTGTVYSERFLVRNSGASYTSTFIADSGATAPLILRNANGVSGTRGQTYFYYDGTFVGSITSTSTSTSYNTSSDYRLKENVVELTGATERLKQLNPSRFNFIADADTTVDGFLAHEVADVVPEAISGEKDAVDADGNPEYQGIDQSKLVPLLVATIQELEARITQLENN